jgi:RimJ/RimL family protein N-acetyltransferase
LAAGIAVQRLNPKHRVDITRHLLALPERDRYLRFGRAIRDEAIREYVDGLDFTRDRLFGTFGPRLDLIGVAHLALDAAAHSAELGLSVDPAFRVKGHGFALLQRGVLHAANLGYRTLFMHCLAENGVMLHLARKAGLMVLIQSSEADAKLKLSRYKHGGLMLEAAADQFALVDNMLKQQYLWLAQAGIKSPASPNATDADDERRGTAGAAEALEGQVPQRA